MNWTAVVLFIIILILLFLLYRYFYTKTLLDKVVSLKTKPGTTPYEIVYGSLDNPDSVRYYYSFWLYIDTNVPADSNNIIFRRGLEFVLYLRGRRLILSKSNGVENAETVNGVFTPAKELQVMTLTENMPFQKWVHVIVSVDNQNVDAYLDGKLVKSKSGAGMLVSQTTKSILIGNMNTEGKITRFDRVVGQVSPQEALSIYALGNGETNMFGDNYDINLVTKYREIVQGKWKIA